MDSAGENPRGVLATLVLKDRKDFTLQSLIYYGSSGNSFVAVVAFGEQVRARAVTAGGESGDPKSRHFDKEAARYAGGDLREVYFYPAQLQCPTEKTYHPGE
jgi:acyl-homoserine-lactone acylase